MLFPQYQLAYQQDPDNISASLHLLCVPHTLKIVARLKKHHNGALLLPAGVLIIALLMARPQPDAAAVAPVAALTVTTRTLASPPLQRTLAATGSAHAGPE